LEDGRKITLERTGEEYTWSLSLHDRDKKTLWSKRYSTEFDSLWDYAFFVRVKAKSFVYDMDKDGNPEIAISTWDGGNAPNRPAIVFTVKEKELSVFKIVEEYPTESGKSVFN
jgi:hypothetical protein